MMIIVGKKTHSSSRLRTFSGSGLLTFLIGPNAEHVGGRWECHSCPIRDLWSLTKKLAGISLIIRLGWATYLYRDHFTRPDILLSIMCIAVTLFHSEQQGSFRFYSMIIDQNNKIFCKAPLNSLPYRCKIDIEV